jgi:hypothetical protein
MNEELRADFTTVVLAMSSILTFAISWRFWTPYRTFPVVPYLNFLNPSQLSVVVFAFACIGLVIACTQKYRALGLGAFLFGTAFLVLEDQSRLQPYIYLEMIIALGLLWHTLKGASLTSIRMALVCVYFWSGAHKLNVNYFSHVFPWVLFGGRITHGLSFLAYHPTILKTMALLSALMETGAAVLLYYPAMRKFGIAMVIIIHVTALLLIGPLGLNYAPVVWPWNFAMMAYTIILFWDCNERILHVGDPIQAVTIVLFGILPALNLFSMWDAYPSFHAFSGATVDAYLEIATEKKGELPPAALRAMTGNRIYFTNWSLSDAKTSAYPAKRVYRHVFRQLCASAPDALLVIVSKPEWPSGRTTETREPCPVGDFNN